MKKIKELLKEASYWVLFTHVHPDADGMGSLLALHLALRERGKTTLPLVEGSPPSFLEFLHGFKDLVTPDRLPRDFPYSESVAVVLDLSEEERVGDLAPVLRRIPRRIVLDHHAQTGSPLPGEHYSDPTAPATALLVWRLLRELNWSVSPAVAENLYTGLYSDTGGFRFENTGEEAFVAAAEMVRCGARPSWVGEHLLENYPPVRFELLRRVLERREFLAGGRGVVSFLALEDFEELGGSPAEAEDLATFLRSMRGVEVSALVKELKPGEVGVSLRSRGSIDVARLAASEGGGGHRRAAGFRKRDLSLFEVLHRVKSKIEALLEE